MFDMIIVSKAICNTEIIGLSINL